MNLHSSVKGQQRPRRPPVCHVTACALCQPFYPFLDHIPILQQLSKIRAPAGRSSNLSLTPTTLGWDIVQSAIVLRVKGVCYLMLIISGRSRIELRRGSPPLLPNPSSFSLVFLPQICKRSLGRLHRISSGRRALSPSRPTTGSAPVDY